MNMLSSVTPWDSVAEGYAETTMKFFQGYVDYALALVDLDENSHVLDVACGPGTLALAAAKRARTVKAIDFSEAMISILERKITGDDIQNLETYCGDAQNLPYADESFDAAFSMFGLMFFPDRSKGYAEIHRTLKPGGKVIISSWAPVAQSPAMQAVFGALRAMNPAVPEPQTDIESLENPEFFKTELRNAGFKDVEVQRVTRGFPVESVEQFWTDMVRGNAPLVMMKNSVSKEEWQEKNQLALQYLYTQICAVPTSLTSDAWIATGTK